MPDYLLLALILAGFGLHYLQGALRSRRLRKSLQDLLVSPAEDECSAVAGDSLLCHCGSH